MEVESDKITCIAGKGPPSTEWCDFLGCVVADLVPMGLSFVKLKHYKLSNYKLVCPMNCLFKR